MMIMEKITHKLGDQTTPNNIDESKALMVCLAKVHAYFWGDSHPKNKMLSMPNSPTYKIAGGKLKAKLKPMLKMVKDITKYEPPQNVVDCLLTT